MRKVDKDYLCIIILSKKESNTKKSTKKGDKLGILHEIKDWVIEVDVEQQ